MGPVRCDRSIIWMPTLFGQGYSSWSNLLLSERQSSGISLAWLHIPIFPQAFPKCFKLSITDHHRAPTTPTAGHATDLHSCCAPAKRHFAPLPPATMVTVHQSSNFSPHQPPLAHSTCDSGLPSLTVNNFLLQFSAAKSVLNTQAVNQKCT